MLESQKLEFRAQTIELFFDLVFVFVVTRLTHLVEHVHEPVEYLHALAVLMLVWWMYGGYIWLTNHAHTPKTMRLVLVAAMAGFMVLALSAPVGDAGNPLVFGFAYLFVIILHFCAFIARGGRPAAGAMLRIVPFNIAAALLVIAAGTIEAEWRWVLLLAPAGLYAVVAVMNTGEGFALDPVHFVERHGLLLIIVLGETIIAIGTGLADHPLTGDTILRLVLSIALIAALWWSYFDADDQRAEHRMLEADNRRRTRIALFAYTMGHLAMVAGLILVAAGLKASIAYGTEGESGHGADFLLLLGTGGYLLADAAFRRIVGLRPVALRVLAGLALIGLALVSVPLHGASLIGLTLAILLLLLALEGRFSATSSGMPPAVEPPERHG